jgi:hypothetical protein
MTVADGKTTYGDGQGNLSPGAKYGSDEEAGVVHVDWDPLDEDSPYPEVRASVSNLDDRDMPGESPVPCAPLASLLTLSLYRTGRVPGRFFHRRMFCIEHVLLLQVPFAPAQCSDRRVSPMLLLTG